MSETWRCCDGRFAAALRQARTVEESPLPLVATVCQLLGRLLITLAITRDSGAEFDDLTREQGVVVHALVGP
jgi:hypothetical protein